MLKYFRDSEEYPNFAGYEILPHGVLWEYISSTFLNGMVNYCKPLSAYLLHRYQQDPEVNKKAATKFIQDADFHSDLDMGDDLLMLSQAKGTNEFWYFWFDHDVSDCQIGRFFTGDAPEKVAFEFRDHALRVQERLGYVEHKQRPIHIPGDVFKGWMKF